MNHNMARILGSSVHSVEDRQKHDFYATDPKALALFLDKIAEDNLTLSKYIWEPACGDGELSKKLIERGYNVLSTDLIDRGYGHGTLDFTKSPFNFAGDILTNPPFKHAAKFVEKALNTVPKNGIVVMFLRLQFLEGVARGKMFDAYPPKYVYVHRKRVNTFKNNDPKERKKTSAVCFAWFWWEKGFKGDPTLRWL
jgi:hypothetical protein